MPPKKRVNKTHKTIAIPKPVNREEEEEEEGDELSETSDAVMRRDDVGDGDNEKEEGSDDEKPFRLLNRIEAESDEDDNLDQDIDDVDDEEEEEEEADEYEDGYDEDSEDVDVKDKDKCVYNQVDDGYASDKSDKSEGYVEDMVFDDEEEGVEDTDNTVKDEERVTKPIMTKFERVRIIGDRSNQLSLGAKSMIKNSEQLSSKEIAELELEYNIIPIIIIRPLPNGKQEKWRVKDLQH